MQEAAEERGAAAVQAREEPRRRGSRLRQDGDVHVARVPHAEGDVPEGQVHLQHEGVQGCNSIQSQKLSRKLSR